MSPEGSVFLGVDPGIATTGFGVICRIGHSLSLLEYGTIRTPAGDSMPHRLHSLSIELKALLQKWKPVSMGVEELFFNTNVKTALIVGQARGVVLLTGAQQGCPIASYTPPQVKMGVCGYGKADKRQVQDMVKRLLNLAQIPKPDDAADALAVAICHSQSYTLTRLIG